MEYPIATRKVITHIQNRDRFSKRDDQCTYNHQIMRVFRSLPRQTDWWKITPSTYSAPSKQELLRAPSDFSLMSTRHGTVSDAVETDPDKYKVIFENDRVRVFDYTDRPGDKTKLHHHPDSVVYILGPFKRKLTLDNGKSVVREGKAGQIAWNDEQLHIGENVGDTNTHVLIVELKEPRPRAQL